MNARDFIRHTHYRPHVRRRALLAFSALSRYEPDLLRRITPKVLMRLQDSSPEVVGAALTVSRELIKVRLNSIVLRSTMTK